MQQLWSCLPRVQISCYSLISRALAKHKNASEVVCQASEARTLIYGWVASALHGDVTSEWLRGEPSIFADKVGLRIPVIGYLGSGPERNAGYLSAFRQGLGEIGYIEGQNFAIESR